MRSLSRTSLILSACVGLGLTACNQNSSPGNLEVEAGEAKPAEIGASLYKAAPMPQLGETRVTPEPIVIQNAVVQSDVRVQVPARVDGLIEMIATPLGEGENFDPNDPRIVYHPRDLDKSLGAYRELRENDIVRKDQVLARLDSQLMSLQVENTRKLITETKKSIVAALEAENAYVKQKELAEQGGQAKYMAQFEKLSLDATIARLRGDRLKSEAEVAKLEGELLQARVQLDLYWVRSPVNGRIVKLMKSPQEFARAGDVIMEIQGTDRYRVEGKLDLQYATMVHRGMKVTVEPARPVGPKPIANYHRQKVNAVAVTGHPGRPAIVSGGGDETALVWDVTQTKKTHRLPHPVGVSVTALATTSPHAKKQLVVTGGADGKLRLWDVSNLDALPQKPMKVFDDSHTAAVEAIEFSRDGNYLATAAGRVVYIWNVAEGKKLYALPQEHRDMVTTLHFTPQATLVTVSRDKTIRTWTLGQTGANVATVLDHRGGSVNMLGITSDGGRMLFDKSQVRLDIVNLADQRSVATLQNYDSGTRFETLALFSPDDSLVLTGSEDAMLTVWEVTPEGGRGAERQRMMTPHGSAVTCAAFSPDPTHRFIVAGTSTGGVHFWETPKVTEANQAMEATVVSVLPADARSVTVRVELANPDEGSGNELQDRSLATIIIDPQAATVPVPQPQPEAIVPAAGVVQPDEGVVHTSYEGQLPMKPATEQGGLVLPPAQAPGPIMKPIAEPKKQ